MMEKWMETPLIIIAVIAGLSFLYAIFSWISNVNRIRKGYKADKKSLESGIQEKVDKQEFKSAIERIEGWVIEIFKRLPPAPSELSAGSPLQLTDFGNKLADHISANEWADQLCASGDLQRQVEGKSPYEIQEFCLDFVQSKLDYDDRQLELLRQCAYENGVKILNVQRVLGILLRNKLLEKQSPPASN